jgi:hypothetical protein
MRCRINMLRLNILHKPVPHSIQHCSTIVQIVDVLVLHARNAFWAIFAVGLERVTEVQDVFLPE